MTDVCTIMVGYFALYARRGYIRCYVVESKVCPSSDVVYGATSLEEGDGHIAMRADVERNMDVDTDVDTDVDMRLDRGVDVDAGGSESADVLDGLPMGWHVECRCDGEDFSQSSLILYVISFALRAVLLITESVPHICSGAL